MEHLKDKDLYKQWWSLKHFEGELKMQREKIETELWKRKKPLLGDKKSKTIKENGYSCKITTGLNYKFDKKLYEENPQVFDAKKHPVKFEPSLNTSKYEALTKEEKAIFQPFIETSDKKVNFKIEQIQED